MKNTPHRPLKWYTETELRTAYEAAKANYERWPNSPSIIRRYNEISAEMVKRGME